MSGQRQWPSLIQKNLNQGFKIIPEIDWSSDIIIAYWCSDIAQHWDLQIKKNIHDEDVWRN